MLALCASFTALVIDVGVALLNGWKGTHKDNWLIWIPTGLACAAVAQAIIKYISPEAAGSGIPQMKAIMTGVTLPKFLSFRTYLGKVLGMIFMLCSGMSLGKEGPFVHIASTIANSLPYKQKETNRTIKH